MLRAHVPSGGSGGDIGESGIQGEWRPGEPLRLEFPAVGGGAVPDGDDVAHPLIRSFPPFWTPADAIETEGRFRGSVRARFSRVLRALLDGAAKSAGKRVDPDFVVTSDKTRRTRHERTRQRRTQGGHRMGAQGVSAITLTLRNRTMKFESDPNQLLMAFARSSHVTIAFRKYDSFAM